MGLEFLFGSMTHINVIRSRISAGGKSGLSNDLPVNFLGGKRRGFPAGYHVWRLIIVDIIAIVEAAGSVERIAMRQACVLDIASTNPQTPLM